MSDAVKALVTQSANDAAVVIAENLAGTEENFARLMTDTGRRIGMKNTVFRNASGLPNDEQITTARDMAILAAHLIHDYPEYYTVFETRYFTFKGRKYRNHNKLLFGYKGTDGIKTGYTRASGFNLTASVHRGNKHLAGGRARRQDRQPARRGHARPARQALRRKPPRPSRHRAQLMASLDRSAASAAAGDQEACLDAGASHAGPSPKSACLPRAISPSRDLPLSRLSLSHPTPKPRQAKSVRYAGAFHVQVGAFMSQADAENRLGMVQQRAIDLLDGHLPFTASFMKDDQEWYRARFAGFSQGRRRSAPARR